MRTEIGQVTVVTTTTELEAHNMNNLNCPPQRLAPPDLLENVLRNPDSETALRNRLEAEKITEKEKRSAPMTDFRDQCGCNACRKPRKPRSKHHRRIVRGLCCLGWIFCCPVFTMGWALRTAPIDKQDLQEDDCYPCFTIHK